MSKHGYNTSDYTIIVRRKDGALFNFNDYHEGGTYGADESSDVVPGAGRDPLGHTSKSRTHTVSITTYPDPAQVFRAWLRKGPGGEEAVCDFQATRRRPDASIQPVTDVVRDWKPLFKPIEIGERGAYSTTTIEGNALKTLEDVKDVLAAFQAPV